MNRLFTAAGTASIALLLAAPSLALAAAAPAATATPQGPLAYYIMAGTTIISEPFTDPDACKKAVLKMQKDPQPGRDQLVCAHRRP